MREYALVLLVTAAVTYVLTPLVRRVAVATGAMHEPRARDMHKQATPLLGGLAMYGGLVAGLVVAGRLPSLDDPFQTAGSKTAAGLLLAGGLVVVVGFIDDRYGLSAISKLAGQVAAAGILVWSGQALPWLPMPSGGEYVLEPDLSVTLTVLLVVVTINAINFIDGLDGLAAGIVAVAALSFLVYSYTLLHTIGSTSQSLPAVSSALLAGMCLGFLPHNFFPARIFMGDIGAMLLGLMLAYGPISSTSQLDPALLTNYVGNHVINRFPTFLPLLVPAAIFIIPYTDLMFAIIRRIRAGRPVMAPDREHLHHRLLTIGHSYRQSVLIMYLWAALFSVTVVSLSVVRTRLVVLEAATIIAVLALLPVTMPRLRPWHSGPLRRPAPAPSRATALTSDAPGAPGARRHRADRAEAARSGRSPRDAPPLRARAQGPGPNGPPPSAVAPPSDPVFHTALPSAAAPLPGPAFHAALPSAPTPLPGPVFHAAPTVAPTPATPGETPWFTNGGYQADVSWAPGEPHPRLTSEPHSRLTGEPLPRAGRLPGTEPVYPGYPADPAYPAYSADPQDPFTGPGWRPSPGYLPAGGSFSGPGPFVDPLADGGAPEVLEPLPQAQQRDLRPWWGRDLDFSLPLFTLPLPSPDRCPSGAGHLACPGAAPPYDGHKFLAKR
jgi:UDP-GlcNAc:undecaprenyl-phosphate/decaprenyl-phosphate GlcNAc-1-phosphate transferase